MTDDAAKRLAEIRARAEAATPGPWWTYLNDIHYDTGVASETSHIASLRHDVDEETDSNRGPKGRIADSEFIAHSREDVEWLCEQLEIAVESSWIPYSGIPPNWVGTHEIEFDGEWVEPFARAPYLAFRGTDTLVRMRPKRASS